MDNNQTYATNPWYAPQQTTNPAYVAKPQSQNQVSQFVWITNPGVVDMWPINPGCEMTFIDSENMMIYVKRVDEYNHPLKTKKFKMTEIIDEETKPNVVSQINMDELKSFISGEIERAVSNKMSNMFSFKSAEEGEH